jgi:hypothetical protein
MARIDQLWEEYCEAERDRIRSVSVELLHGVIEEVKALSDVERKSWVFGRCRESIDMEPRYPVRFPLFREVLFPELIKGVRSKEPGPARWLAGFSHLLYKSPDCVAQLEESEAGEIRLLQLALQADPSDEASRVKLIAAMAWEFGFSLHELPTGVLYGGNGASIEDCAELLKMLEEFEKLIAGTGHELEYAELVARGRLHFTEYPKYLSRGEDFESYWEFLGWSETI